MARTRQTFWLLVLVGALLAALGIAPPARAETRTWTGADNDLWFNADNWHPVGRPARADDLTIDTGTPNTRNAVTTDDDGSITVTGPANAALSDSYLYVGREGAGTLTIEAGGQFSSGDWVSIGRYAGSTGTVTVTGAASTWTSDGNTWVGYEGAGTLTIEAGGQVSHHSIILGGDSGSTGTATVTGAGSTWTSDWFTVGSHGTGTLTIEAGGQVRNTYGSGGGSFSGSNCTVTVTGTGSMWTTGNQLVIGGYGAGTLMVEAGGQVISSDGGWVGSGAGGTGTVTVTGAGSTWTNSSILGVGVGGAGTLTIEAGGQVSSGDWGYIGYDAGSTGAVTVDGAGSTCNGRYLYVGVYGAGTLTVTGGGQVASDWGYMGYYAGSTGAVTVDGEGSTWTSTSAIHVGIDGAGTLAVTGGGQVASGTAYLGYRAGSTGEVTVDGGGSMWTTTGNLYLGGSDMTSGGTGTLAVTGGGQVASDGGFIGYYAGSTGAVTVDGEGSTWTSTSSIYLGSSGAGTLAVTGGGQVASSAIYVGISGAGTLAVTGGGQVASDKGSIGYYAGSTGAVTVDGEGSTWTSTSGIYVGISGAGTLAVTGGEVSAQQLFVGPQGHCRVDRGVTYIGHEPAYQPPAGSLHVGTGGEISLASGALVEVAGGYRQTADGRLTVELAGTDTGQYGQMCVGGGAWLAGTLKVNLADGYRPRAGDRYPIMTYSHLPEQNDRFDEFDGSEAKEVTTESRSFLRPSYGEQALEICTGKVLLDVPEYHWNHGCTPTSAGMLMAYWDQNGFSNLVDGSVPLTDMPSSNRPLVDHTVPLPSGGYEVHYRYDPNYGNSNVNELIASEAHFLDYWDPVVEYDSNGDLVPGSDTADPMAAPGLLPHMDDCLADYLNTSRGSLSNGGTWPSDIESGLENWAEDCGYDVDAGDDRSPTFEELMREIEMGSPVLLGLALDGGNDKKHRVLAYGYRDGGPEDQWFAVRDTWVDGVSTRYAIVAEADADIEWWRWNTDKGNIARVYDLVTFAFGAGHDRVATSLSDPFERLEMDGVAEGLLYDVLDESTDASGQAVLTVSPLDPDDPVLKMTSQTGDPICASQEIDVGPDLRISFDFLFEEPGELEVLLGETVLDTLLCSDSGSGSSGSPRFGQYWGRFQLMPLGLDLDESYDFGMRLSAIEESALYLDNLEVISLPWCLVWMGATDDTWDVAATVNWFQDGAPDAYYDGDNVVLDDTGGGGAVTLAETVAPCAVFVENDALDYTLTGPGKIAGWGGLTKCGGGSLTVATANTYTGDTLIGAGTVVAASDGALGRGTVRLGSAMGSADAALLVDGPFTVENDILVQHDGSGTSTRTLGGTNTDGAAIFSGDVALGADLLLTAEPGGEVRFDGMLDNAEGHTLLKVGGGTVVFDGLQYHGPGSLLDIQDGLLVLNTDASGTGLMDDANLSILVAGAELHFGCNQHLDTLTIDEGGLARFTGANVVVLKHLVMDGIDLGAMTLTPEPATLALLAAGLGALLVRKRRT